MTLRRIQPARPRKSILALGLSLAILAAAPASWAADAADGVLVVTFHGLKAGGGAIMASLAAGPEAYDGKAPAAAQGMVQVQGDTVTITFGGLAPGRYAVRAFHDVNGDGKLGTNPFGVPTEPYAFSNNAHAAMGPPPWTAAAFEVKAGQNVQTIDID